MNEIIQSKIDLRNLTKDQLIDFTTEMGLSRYRGKQIFAWLYRPGISHFSEMTDLSKKVRKDLEVTASLSRLSMKAKEVSEDGTIKYGFALDDAYLIESVLIPEDERMTLCISSQAGCAMGCAFCRTGRLGFRRNLQAAEIVNQVYQVQEDLLLHKNKKITNLVFMGMGEPLANLNNLLTAITILLDQQGLNFSERKITVSTCGLIPQINEFGSRSKVGLALSLHSAFDDLRSKLMPINVTYSLSRLMDCLEQYPLPKRKRIMIEYVMLDGVNDSEKDAKQLAKILRRIPCKINLLPLNPCEDIPYQPSKPEQLERFQDFLRNAGYTVLVRNSRGADISAACGQLAGDI